MGSQLWSDEDGLTSLEYALLLALVAMSALASWEVLGRSTADGAKRMSEQLPGATGANTAVGEVAGPASP